MAAADLVALARKFIALNEEIDAVRNEIRRCVLDGAGDAPPRPTRRAAGPGDKRTAVMERAQIADERVVALLRDKPGMGLSEIARAVGDKPTTAANRVKRIAQRGLIERSGGGWAATSQP